MYGELLDALHLYHVQLGDLHPEIQRFVADLADTAAHRWHETDAGPQAFSHIGLGTAAWETDRARAAESMS